MTDSPEWHLNSHEGQKGPYTTAYIQEMWNSGAIHGACHVWRKGFDEWQELRSVHVFEVPDVDSVPEHIGDNAVPGDSLDNKPAAALAV